MKKPIQTLKRPASLNHEDGELWEDYEGAKAQLERWPVQITEEQYSAILREVENLRVLRGAIADVVLREDPEFKGDILTRLQPGAS